MHDHLWRELLEWRRRRLLAAPPVRNSVDLNEARRGCRQAFLARFLYTWMGIVILAAYMTLVFGLPFVLRFLWPSVVGVTIAFAVGGVAAWWFMRRSLRLYRAKDEPAAEFLVDDDLRREALNIPLSIALVDFALWISIGTVLTAILIHGTSGQVVRLIVHGLTSAIFAGHLTAILEFYAMEQLLGRSFYPFVMRGKRISEIRGVVAVPIYIRIGMLVLTTSVGPMFFLFLANSVGDAHGMILLFMIVFTVVSGIWQGVNVVASVSLPIGRMAGIFERFKQNHDEAEQYSHIYRADALGRFAEMFDELVGTIQERDFIRSTFGRYVSRQVVDEILNGRVELGGTLQHATVLFADIRGFTTLSERLQPGEVVELLNEYLENMVQAITANEGIPDKFIGDGIMAVWGVPVECEAHPEKAVQAAFDMLQKLEEMNARRGAIGAEPIRIGIGVHTGDLISGNIGSKKKMEFTVIGDTVNTCSRIESANKALGAVLTISEAVYAALPEAQRAQFQPAPPQQLRGKGNALTLYVWTAEREASAV
jgi:class 3 adenylate cyclase